MKKLGLATFLSVLCLGLLAGVTPGATHATTPTPPTLTPQGHTEICEVDIKLTENPYTFQPDAFVFKGCTTYRLTFNAPREFHTFTVEGLGLDVFINTGDPVVVEFTPEKEGTFELVCIPHEALGMVGEVQVELGTAPPTPTPTHTPTPTSPGTPNLKDPTDG